MVVFDLWELDGEVIVSVFKVMSGEVMSGMVGFLMIIEYLKS